MNKFDGHSKVLQSLHQTMEGGGVRTGTIVRDTLFWKVRRGSELNSVMFKPCHDKLGIVAHILMMLRETARY